MLKVIETLAQGKVLAAKEQQEILGGKVGIRCIDGNCDDPNTCCSHGYCVSTKPGPGGLLPACE